MARNGNFSTGCAQRLVSVFMVVTFTGCLPMLVPAILPAEGYIRDEVTDQGVPSARITVRSTDDPSLVQSAVADATGRYRIFEVERRRWMPLAPFDLHYGHLYVELSAPGYMARRAPFHVSDGQWTYTLKPL